MPHAVARRRHAVTWLSTAHFVRRCVAAAGIAVVFAAAHAAPKAQVARVGSRRTATAGIS